MLTSYKNTHWNGGKCSGVYVFQSPAVCVTFHTTTEIAKNMTIVSIFSMKTSVLFLDNGLYIGINIQNSRDDINTESAGLVHF